MRDLTFTLYPSARATKRGEPLTLPWNEWVARYFSKHDRRAEKDGPCIALGRIPKGAGRGNALLETVEALAVDVEKKPDAEVEAALDKLSPFAYALWTTHRHGTEWLCRDCGKVREQATCPGCGRELSEKTSRLRIVLPLARPLAAAEHAEAWRRLQHLLGGVNDEQTKDPARLHYLPSAPPRREEVLALATEGRWLDASELPRVPLAGAPQTREFTESEVKAAHAQMLARLGSLPRSSPMRDAGRAVADGAPFAEPDARHQAILDLTWFLAESYSDAPPEAVAGLFAPSLAAMPDTDQTTKDVSTAFVGAVEKIRRRKNPRWADLEDAYEPYSDEDLARIAGRQGWEPKDLGRRWIVQVDTTFFLLRECGTYSRGYSYHEARPAAARVLARAPVRLNEPTQSGFRRRPIAELVEDYGIQAQRLVSDLSAQATTYDPINGALREAVCPLRPIEPKEDAEVDRWLRALGGDDAERLLDWVAAATRLDRACAALYLSGAADAGKSLLPTGLARLWTEGSPSKLPSMLGKHNEGLATCPLVLVDESLPPRHDGQPMSAVLRTAISETRRPLSRKYKAEASLVGAIRLVLTSNNSFLLQDDEAHGQQDRAAIAQRFFYLQVGRAAAKVLDEHRGEIQREWIEGDRIAAHALWLNRTRTLKEDGRFLVQGQETEMHRQLATGGSAWNRWVCEWLVRYMDEPSLQDAKGDGRVLVGNGEMLVNVMAVVEGWELYASVSHKDPDTSRIGEALAAISQAKVQRRWKGRRHWYHLIDHENLIDWSNRHGVGDEERMRELVKAKRDTREAVGPVPPPRSPFAKIDRKGRGKT